MHNIISHERNANKNHFTPTMIEIKTENNKFEEDRMWRD